MNALRAAPVPPSVLARERKLLLLCVLALLGGILLAHVLTAATARSVRTIPSPDPAAVIAASAALRHAATR